MDELTTNTTTTGATADNVVTDTVATANSIAPTDPAPDVSAELAKLRAELAKANSKNDQLAKENAEQKKAIRAKQSAEEIAAEEKRIADEARDKELADLRKRFAVAETSKKVMSFVSDESASTQIAEYLYGAEDADAAIDAFNKAWIAREKALRLEYGKIPAPGVGASNGPTVTRQQLDEMTYIERAEYAAKYPDDYARIMGRK